MDKLARPVSACTTNPNTPESDMQPKVWHTVTYTDGTTTKVMATDPMDAMDRALERPSKGA